MNYGTYTTTYTVVDIRKAFESFEADLRMIARRTEKWTTAYVDNIFYDIIKLAESKYLSRISITLNDSTKVVQATRYTVNEAGTSISGARAGGNDWANIPGTYLSVTLEYSSTWHALSKEAKELFQKNNSFKISWGPSTIDTNFPNLTKQAGQTYASNGYEITKDNFK